MTRRRSEKTPEDETQGAEYREVSQHAMAKDDDEH